jgi:hypothetical protein
VNHLTDDQVARWRSRSLEREEILYVGDHVAACAECSRLLAAPHTPQKVAGELDRWLDESQKADHLRTRSRFRIGLAALAACVVAAVGVVLVRRDAGPASPESVVRKAPADLLRDGALVVDARGHVEGVAPRWRGEVESVVRGATLIVPQVAASLARGTERIRGAPTPGAESVRLLDPLSVVRLDERPLFSWQGPAGARYRAEVYDDRFVLVAKSPTLESDSWRPPNALPRAQLLTWRLVATRSGKEEVFPAPPAPPAIFYLAPEAAVAEVEEARRTGSRLVTGLALWRAGAVKDAEAEFEALQRENPTSALARRLAGSTR